MGQCRSAPAPPAPAPPQEFRRRRRNLRTRLYDLTTKTQSFFSRNNNNNAKYEPLTSLQPYVPSNFHVFMIIARGSKCLVMGHASCAYLFDLQNGVLICELPQQQPHRSWIVAGDLFVDAQDDSKFIVCTVGIQHGEAMIYENASGAIRIFHNYFHVSWAMLSPSNGKRLVCSSADGICRVWDIDSNACIGDFTTRFLDGYICSSVFKAVSGNGDWIVSEVQELLPYHYAIAVWTLPTISAERDALPPSPPPVPQLRNEIRLDEYFLIHGGTNFLRLSEPHPTTLFIWTGNPIDFADDFDELQENRFYLYDLTMPGNDPPLFNSFIVPTVIFSSADFSPNLSIGAFGEISSRRMFVYDMMRGQLLCVLESPFRPLPYHRFGGNSLADVSFFSQPRQDHVVACSVTGQFKTFDLQWERETVAREALRAFLPAFLKYHWKGFTVDLFQIVANFLTMCPVYMSEETLKTKYLFTIVREV